MSLFSISFSIFLLMDPIGNIPIYLSVLKKYEGNRQFWIILRESFFALITILFFTFFGGSFLSFLNISQATISVSGGIILFLISLKMIFSSSSSEYFDEGEPLVFPLAIPLVAGPSVLAGVMIYSSKLVHIGKLTIGVLIAWFFCTIILLLAPQIRYLLREKGVKAMEKLMGLILVMIGIQMFLEGWANFMTKIS